MAKNIDVESAMAEAAQYIVGPEEAEKMLKNLKKNASYMDAFEDDDYEVLADVLDFLRFQPNDPLVTKGEDASWCGFIMEGSVGVVVGGKQVAAMHTGKLIGGMAYFFGATRTADCCGGENGGVLAAIEFDALRELEKNSPKIALRFINCIATGELENLLSRISRMEGNDPEKDTKEKKKKKSKKSYNAKHKAEVLYRSKAAAAAKEAKRIKKMMDKQAAEVAKMKASKRNEKHVQNQLKRQLTEKEELIKTLKDQVTALESGSSGNSEASEKMKKMSKKMKEKIAELTVKLKAANERADAMADGVVDADELKEFAEKLKKCEHMVESYKLKYEQSEEENEELKLRLKNMEKQILEGSSQSDKLNSMIQDHNNEMKTQHTKLLFALNDIDVLQNNLYLKEQQISDMAKLIETLTNENKAKDKQLQTSGHEMQSLIDDLRNQLAIVQHSLKQKTSDLFSLKVLTKMLHDGNARRDRKITNVKSELSKLSHQYNVTLKQLNVVEETCKLYTNLFLNQTYVHSTTQNELQLLTGQYKALALKRINDVQLARNQERLRLEQINNEIKDSLLNSISELNETMKTLKNQQETEILKLNKQHEDATREITIRYNQRFQELTSELQNSSNKIVVQDLRLKKVNNENETLTNSLQHSHMLCANMISLLKSADHFILREYRKKQVLVDGLTYITNEYSNTYSRKSTLESYFGGLALKNGSPSSNGIDLLNHNTPMPSISNADVEESKKTTHLTNRLGLSPRHTSQTPKPYLSLYNIHNGNDMRRGIKKTSILLHSPTRPQNTSNSRSMFNVKRSKSIKRLKSNTLSPKRSMKNVILGKHLNDKHDRIYNNKAVPGGGNMYSSSMNNTASNGGRNHAVTNEKVSLKQQLNMVKFNTLSYLSTSQSLETLLFKFLEFMSMD